MSHIIYQTGTLNSLLEAVYTGDKTIEDILQHGDFGLGTYDRIDGEMIVCDGVCYHADADGQLSVAGKHLKTPFAALSRFHAHHTNSINKCNYSELKSTLKKQFISPNIVYAIKVHGLFEKIDLRSESCKALHNIKLTELLPKIQHSFERENILGTLVGLWFPQYMSTLNIPGFHFHFVDDTRTIGGHVFDFTLHEGTVAIQEIHSFRTDLIHSNAFYHADLSRGQDDALSKIEDK